VKELRAEAAALKEAVADLTLENRLLKKSLTGAGDDREVPGRREARDHLPVRRTLARIGVPPATFYRWYDRYRELGPEGLEDRSPRPGRVWNRIPEPVRERILALALEAPELSSRELAIRFTDEEKYFVSEVSV
jgi:transposase-like protein